MTRRSVRAFTGEPVGEEELDVLLRAAMAAPSATNERPWRFVVVREPATLERLSRATPFARPMASASVGIVVTADRRGAKYPGFWVIDCSASIQNLLLAAHATGLGAVWIGVHPIRPFAWNVRRVVGLPRPVMPHSLVAVGRPLKTPDPVDRFEGGWIHSDRW